MSMHSHGSDSFELALRALREEEGTHEQARVLEQHLLDKLGPEALAAPFTRASASLSRLWWLLGLGVLLGTSMLMGRPQRSFVAHVEQVEQPAQLVSAPRASVQPSPVASGMLAPSPHVAPPVEPAQPVKRRSIHRTPRRLIAPQAPASSAAPPLEGELSLLLRSRSSLRDDPAAALRLTDQHARDYPAGVFVQEREVLAIEALLKQKRVAEGLERAERFVAEQPSSTYAVRVRELLATKPRGAAP